MSYLRGIDVSHWQGTTPSLAGLGWIAARATFGTTPDDKFAMHMANGRAAGLGLMAYHFGDPTKSVSSQLAVFLRAAGSIQKCVLDIEAGDITLAQARVFIAGLKAAGKTAGVYHSLSSYPWDLGQDFDWLAAWGSVTPPGPWEFWQYRGSPLDLDYFNGTRSEFDALAHGSYIGDPMTPLPIADHIPRKIDVAAPMTFYDVDGSILSTGHGAQTNVDSPHKAMNGTSTFYAMYAGPAPYQLILVKPSAVRGIAAPVSDCTAAVKAAVDPVKSQLAAALTAAAASGVALATAKTALQQAEEARVAALAEITPVAAALDMLDAFRLRH